MSKLTEGEDHRAKHVILLACCAKNVMIFGQLFINYLNMNGCFEELLYILSF